MPSSARDVLCVPVSACDVVPSAPTEVATATVPTPAVAVARSPSLAAATAVVPWPARGVSMWTYWDVAAEPLTPTALGVEPLALSAWATLMLPCSARDVAESPAFEVPNVTAPVTVTVTVNAVLVVSAAPTVLRLCIACALPVSAAVMTVLSLSRPSSAAVSVSDVEETVLRL